MTSQHPLAGVYAAAVTPLRSLDSTLDLESVPVILNFLAARGCLAPCSLAQLARARRSRRLNVKC